ncbi:sugar transferase [Falsiroseomonas sp. HW251]|uniref:sugar transferase n=1 Tax=Falsiroseomonas sp. HW251 TaxID=3390998 RepID=UPI003D31DF96
MYARGGKRALDLVAGAVLLALLAPVMAVIALAVAARLGLPVIFRQDRAGQGGVPFRLLKFRSMREGPGSDEERLDSFGRALRRSGLDELPQLLNVLRGEMSLVGPRPLPLHYVPLYSPRQALRLAVRPGIAGPGVAAGRNAISWAARLELDARYAGAPPTLAGDALLVMGTLGVWARGSGAAAAGHATMPPFRGGPDT